jgi:hypothetical protein
VRCYFGEEGNEKIKKEKKRKKDFVCLFGRMLDKRIATKKNEDI